MKCDQENSRLAVTLRDVVEDDLPVLFEHQCDPVANAMAAFPPRERDAFMVHWAKILKDETLIKKAILVHGEVVGNVGSFAASGQRLLGYWLGREFWGRGIASAAVASFLEFEKARPLHARIAKHNLGSIRVLEKCGFEVCGEDTFTNSEGCRIGEFVMELKAVQTPRRIQQ